MYRVLLVEDDRGIAEALCAQLGDWGFAVRAVENFRDVTGEFRAFDPQLVLLDLMLPFQSGYHWCAELRKISNVPVMFLSSAADNLNIVTAMNMGADDFIAKPFDCAVLVAKMQALLREKFGEYEVREIHGCHAIVVLPTTLPMWEVFRLLESRRQELEIVDYTLSQCTLDQVFLQFAKGQREETEERNAESLLKSASLVC